MMSRNAGRQVTTRVTEQILIFIVLSARLCDGSAKGACKLFDGR